MKTKIVFSLMVITFAVASLVSATLAWFTASTGPIENTFTAGTVELVEDGVSIDGNFENWNPGDCIKVKWCVENSGSKSSYIRIKIDDWWKGGSPGSIEKSAWGEGKKFFDGSWAMYFTAQVGEEKEVKLFADKDIDAGRVKVWIVGEKLYVRYTTNENWKMKETHLAVADDLNLIPKSKGTFPPGLFPFKGEHKPHVTTYTYELPLSGTYSKGKLKGQDYSWGIGEMLYIAAHADLIGTGDGVDDENGGDGGSLNTGNVQWSVKGSDWEQGEDEYWYYKKPVPSGEKVCIAFCVCLDGEETGNEYQGASYRFKFTAEAVQSSNNAADHLWPGHPELEPYK
jgi:hypothetical protein